MPSAASGPRTPDAVVLIDYPGFNFHVAKRAREAGIPVYYFVPPQIWAWRRDRVRKVRKLCTAVLTALPFEDEWYQSRHVRTHYVGHPYFDELAAQQLDPGFLAEQRGKAGVRVGAVARFAESGDCRQLRRHASRCREGSGPPGRMCGSWSRRSTSATPATTRADGRGNRVAR